MSQIIHVLLNKNYFLQPIICSSENCPENVLKNLQFFRKTHVYRLESPKGKKKHLSEKIFQRI